MDKYLKSPFMLMGNKYKLLDWLLDMFPEKIDTFYDMFGGSGTLFLNAKANHRVYNELNKDVYNLLKMFLEKDGEEIIKEFDEIDEKFNLKGAIDVEGNKPFYDFRKYLNRDGYEPTTMEIFVYLRYAFSHNLRRNAKGKLNNSFFSVDSGLSQYHRDRIRVFKDKVKDISGFYNTNALNFDYSKVKQDDFLYFDPPYTNTDAVYLHNGAWTEKDEDKLLKILDDLDKRGIRWGFSNTIRHKGVDNVRLIDWARKNGYIIKTRDIKYGIFKRNDSIECYIYNRRDV